MKKGIVRTYEDTDGSKQIWQYSTTGQLMSVAITHPKNFTSDAEDLKLKNKKLPKTKQRFINPKTGKEISYQRAKELKIIK